MGGWWSNVYDDNCWDGPAGVAYVLDKSHPSREAADRYQSAGRIGCVHVRLKPEGAPRRYVSEAEQDAWEIDPVWSRFHAEQGRSLRYSAGRGFYLVKYA
jgi:hypothetical protein